MASLFIATARGKKRRQKLLVLDHRKTACNRLCQLFRQLPLSHDLLQPAPIPDLDPLTALNEKIWAKSASMFLTPAPPAPVPLTEF